MIRMFLWVIAFIVIISFLTDPIGSSKYMGEIIHAFKQGIEQGLQ